MQAHTSSVARFLDPRRAIGSLGIAPGMSVADFGAGSGSYSLLFGSDVGPTGRVYAIDVQSDLLRRIKNEAIRQGLRNVEIIQGDIERPRGSKLADRSVDLVLMSNLLFQLEDKVSGLAEGWRILKSTGRLVVIDWLDSFRNMGPARQHVVRRDRAHELGRDAGFEFVKEFDAGAHHYGLVFRLSPRPSSI